MGESPLLAAALAALLALVSGAAAGATAPETSPYRLTGEAIPNRYRIALDLDVAGGAFSGHETIELELTSPASSIRLHAVELEIPSARLRADGRTFDLAPRFDREHETVELAASETLPAGEAALELSFRGPLAAGLSGLYLSRDGERTVVATQMQATYARRAFPCFDEPALKAVFELEVELDAELTVVSNGALLREEPAGAGRKRAVFGPSPRMSTYLVALAASRFDVVEGEADGVPIRVFVAPGKGEQGRWALEVALHSLRFYDRWYGIPYPFGKLDLVAIPSYEWGGMENTAAIYFRESVLLFDPATGSPDQRRRIAGLVAHEVAHQWFGDLVTTAWWDDIWLNEGFASWIQSKPVATLRAEWDRPDDDVAEAQEVMGLDALPTTRSIRGTAASPGEIKELFDGVAYTKGAAVIRMIEAYVGEEAFRRGVNAYLERHAWGNARSDDLWRAIAEVSGREVDRILPTFVERPGVPALAFATAAAPGGTRIEIRQERFFLTGDHGGSGELWRLPVCFRWADAAGVVTERCELLGERAGAWSVPGEVTWLVGNAGGRGYYRVAYTGEQLAALAGVAATLPAAERLALVHDAWAMVEANRAGVDDHLRLVERLDGERNRRVIELLIGTIAEVRRVLAAAADEAAFDIWTRARLA
ncbi:MAG TPA: M1 family metallopeptidase, partial [Thermoanaerobaculia bacterium]|nr:M1 family metallopeptidase [Thermoanaerobaculia bacterium]